MKEELARVKEVFEDAKYIELWSAIKLQSHYGKQVLVKKKKDKYAIVSHGSGSDRLLTPYNKDFNKVIAVLKALKDMEG